MSDAGTIAALTARVEALEAALREIRMTTASAEAIFEAGRRAEVCLETADLPFPSKPADRPRLRRVQ